MQSVGHQECLHMKEESTESVFTVGSNTLICEQNLSTRADDMTYSFIFVIHFYPFDGELDGYRSPPPAGLEKDSGHEKVLFGPKMEKSGSIHTGKMPLKNKNYLS